MIVLSGLQIRARVTQWQLSSFATIMIQGHLFVQEHEYDLRMVAVQKMAQTPLCTDKMHIKEDVHMYLERLL